MAIDAVSVEPSNKLSVTTFEQVDLDQQWCLGLLDIPPSITISAIEFGRRNSDTDSNSSDVSFYEKKGGLQLRNASKALRIVLLELRRIVALSSITPASHSHNPHAESHWDRLFSGVHSNELELG